MLMFMGLAFTVMGTYATVQQMRVASFLPVAGVVTDSHVDSSTDSDGHTSYYPRVTFRYEVDGNEYRDGQLRIVAIGGGSKSAQRRAGQYPVGKEVDAFYDPSDPSVAVIQTDVAWMTMFFAVIGMLLMGIGVFMVVRMRIAKHNLGYRRGRRERDSGDEDQAHGLTDSPE